MKVLQYAFDEDPANPHKPHNFDSRNYIAYTGTHDNDTTLGWYKSADEKSKDRFRRYLNVSGEEASWDMIRLAMMSSADLSVYPVQDILSLGGEARLNTPGKLGGNWTFMMEEGALREWMGDRLKYLTELYDRA
jgi:4-alpha-glucanotransferase